MSKRTPLLIHPTLGQVKKEAAQMGLPPREAESFFYYYESNGWRVGKNPMKCWRSALAGWRVRWQGRQQEKLSAKMANHTTSSLDKTIREIEKL